MAWLDMDRTPIWSPWLPDEPTDPQEDVHRFFRRCLLPKSRSVHHFLPYLGAW
jgi:hypothetical protein